MECMRERAATASCSPARPRPTRCPTWAAAAPRPWALSVRSGLRAAAPGYSRSVRGRWRHTLLARELCTRVAAAAISSNSGSSSRISSERRLGVSSGERRQQLGGPGTGAGGGSSSSGGGSRGGSELNAGPKPGAGRSSYRPDNSPSEQAASGGGRQQRPQPAAGRRAGSGRGSPSRSQGQVTGASRPLTPTNDDGGAAVAVTRSDAQGGGRGSQGSRSGGAAFKDRPPAPKRTQRESRAGSADENPAAASVDNAAKSKSGAVSPFLHDFRGEELWVDGERAWGAGAADSEHYATPAQGRYRFLAVPGVDAPAAGRRAGAGAASGGEEEEEEEEDGNEAGLDAEGAHEEPPWRQPHGEQHTVQAQAQPQPQARAPAGSAPSAAPAAAAPPAAARPEPSAGVPSVPLRQPPPPTTPPMDAAIRVASNAPSLVAAAAAAVGAPAVDGPAVEKRQRYDYLLKLDPRRPPEHMAGVLLQALGRHAVVLSEAVGADHALRVLHVATLARALALSGRTAASDGTPPDAAATTRGGQQQPAGATAVGAREEQQPQLHVQRAQQRAQAQHQGVDPLLNFLCGPAVQDEARPEFDVALQVLLPKQPYVRQRAARGGGGAQQQQQQQQQPARVWRLYTHRVPPDVVLAAAAPPLSLQVVDGQQSPADVSAAVRGALLRDGQVELLAADRSSTVLCLLGTVLLRGWLAANPPLGEAEPLDVSVFPSAWHQDPPHPDSPAEPGSRRDKNNTAGAATTAPAGAAAGEEARGVGAREEGPGGGGGARLLLRLCRSARPDLPVRGEDEPVVPRA